MALKFVNKEIQKRFDKAKRLDTTGLSIGPKPRRRVVAKKNTATLMMDQIKKAYALRLLKSLQTDYKTKRNKYVSQKQIQKLIQQLS